MPAYLLLEGVLGREQNQELFEFAVRQHELFAESRTSPNQLYPDWRKSKVIYDRDLKDFATRIEQIVLARLEQALVQLEIPTFELASTEIQLTSHNDGEYYHWHTDNGSPDTHSRTVTFVYYFHSEPKAFSGGELVLYPPRGAAATIAPSNDSMVVFSSGLKHEVLPVRCPRRQFHEGRFTVNGWLRRRVAHHRPRSDYFDARIFGWPRHASAAAVRAALRSDPGPVATRAVAARSGAPSSGAALHNPDAGASAIALLRLYGELYRQSQHTAVDVRASLTGDEFRERYYFANRPVLLKGAMKHSPAVREWTPQFFKRRHGSVPIWLTSGRNSDADYESNFAESVLTTSLADLVDRLEAEPDSNDYYLVARNYFFDHPALAPRVADLQPPSEIIRTDDPRPGTVKLWFGPQGTVTPLHYDEHSIMFAQIYGAKLFKLIPPFDTPRMYVRRRFYSAVDLERVDLERYPDFAEVGVAEVLVEPGDMLFLPVGWWHWVKSLAVSISTTFCSFQVPARNNVLRTPPGV